MFPRAFVIISAVMSTPITRPDGPTCRAARNASNPAAAPEVQDSLAGLQFGDRLRVPAAQGPGQILRGHPGVPHLNSRARPRSAVRRGRSIRCCRNSPRTVPPLQFARTSLELRPLPAHYLQSLPWAPPQITSLPIQTRHRWKGRRAWRKRMLRPSGTAAVFLHERRACSSLLRRNMH